MEKPVVHYTLFDRNRKMLNRLDIKLTSMRMIHDFPVTQNYVIIPDLPFEFKPDKAIREGGFVFKFDPKQDAKYAIMHKMNNDESKIKWFTLPCHYCFHYANAWEEKNDKGHDLVVMFGCPQETVDIALEKDHPFFEDENFRIKFAKFTFNLTTGEADMKYVVDHLSVEFPIINQKFVGLKNRYVFISYLFQTLP